MGARKSKKIVQMAEAHESDREMMLGALRHAIKHEKGISQKTAIKLLWEMLGKPTKKPDTSKEDDEPITFLIAGPLEDDELPSHKAST